MDVDSVTLGEIFHAFEKIHASLFQGALEKGFGDEKGDLKFKQINQIRKMKDVNKTKEVIKRRYVYSLLNCSRALKVKYKTAKPRLPRPKSALDQYISLFIYLTFSSNYF